MNHFHRLGIAGLCALLGASPAGAQTDPPPDPATERVLALAHRLAEQPDDIPPGYVLVGDIQYPIEDFLGGIYGDRATHGPAAYWPYNAVNGRYEVPYAFDTFNPQFPLPPNPGYVNTGNRDAMRNAIAEIQAVCNVTFIELPVSPPGPHLFIRNSTGNNSPVGMTPLNTVNIVSWGTRFIMVHELMHSLGIQHEQSRPDRNSFVQINAGNIQNGEAGNFDLVSNSTALGPYDFDSVMHYDRCAFATACPDGSSCNCSPAQQTITVLPPFAAQWQNAIGQRDHLSEGDRRVLSFLYPYNDWKFVATGNSQPETGTYLNPWHNAPQGLTQTPVGGTLHLMPGSYSGVGLYTRRMLVKGPVGTAVVGR